MIHLITATPGGGKSLRAVQLIIEQYLNVREPRPVFTNIDGFNECGRFRALDLPEDWRDTPEGSVVVIDEVQRVWPAHASGKKPSASAEALDVHRHTGHDFILLTQHPRLLSHVVRSFVQVHEHLTRKGGMGVSFGHRWDGRCSDNPASEFRSFDVEHFTWKHPRQYYSEYRSASLHTVKRRVPKALKTAAVVLPLSIGGVVYAAYTVRESLVKDAVIEPTELVEPIGEVEKEPKQQPPSVPNPVMPEPLVIKAIAYSGVRMGERECRLYDVDGIQLLVRRTDCLNAMLDGLPQTVVLLR